MVFASDSFLFLFLPVFLIVYALSATAIALVSLIILTASDLLSQKKKKA